MTCFSRFRSRRAAAATWRVDDVAVVLLGAAVVFFAGSDTVADVDLWWHIRVGADIAANGGPPARDVYSYLSADRLWMNHEWLAELAMARVFAAAGDAGLIALKLAIAGCVAAGVGLWLRRSGAGTLSSTLLGVSSVLLTLPGWGTVRPQMFSYVLFLAELVVLASAGRRPSSAWSLPLVFAAWINLHGAVIAGVAVMLAWVAAERLVVSDRLRVPLLPVGAALAALALNPWGVHLPWFLRGAVRSRPELVEWGPLDLSSVEGVFYGVALLIAVLGARTGVRQVPVPALLVLAGTAAAPLLARRHLPFFVTASLVLAAPAMVASVGAAVARRWPRAVPQPGGPRWHRAVPLALVAEACVLAALAAPHLRCIRVDASAYPVAAVTRLRDAHAAGRMAVFFDWGGFVLAALGPRLQVSMDPRRETVYSEHAYALNEGFMYGIGPWNTLLQAAPVPDLALVSKAFPTFNLMRREAGWTLVEEDDISGLFVRDGAVAAGPVSSARSTRLRPQDCCFARAVAALGCTECASNGATRDGVSR